MPNWCCTAYTVTGDTQEVKALYEMMKGLEEQGEATLVSDFGKTWLGCLVDALGEDWHNVQCRGHWDGLNFDGRILTFWTLTAWAACNGVFELIKQKFPSLSYFYCAEEPGMCEFYTNDIEGTYYPARYVVDTWTDTGEWLTERFTTLQAAYAWLEEISGMPVRSEQDVQALEKRWKENNPDEHVAINIYPFKVFES